MEVLFNKWLESKDTSENILEHLESQKVFHLDFIRFALDESKFKKPSQDFTEKELLSLVKFCKKYKGMSRFTTAEFMLKIFLRDEKLKPIKLSDFYIGFEYEEYQLDKERYLNKGMIWVKKTYTLMSPRLRKIQKLIEEGKLRKTNQLCQN